MPINKDFIIERQGKSFVLYAGLLVEAHRQGIKRIDTTLLQVPSDANGQTAICHATVEMADGTSWSGIGDANPANVNRMIAAHIIRMAETRSKARALRDALNIDLTAAEELGGDEEPDLPREASKAATNRPRTFSEPLPPAAEAEVERSRQRVAEQIKRSSAVLIHHEPADMPAIDEVRLMIRDLVNATGQPFDEYEKALIARAGVRMGTNLSNAPLDELAPDALDMVREETRKALDKAKKTVGV